jgi:hypothetical protein
MPRLLAVGLTLSLLSWSVPAWSAYLMCQSMLEQGTNCVEITSGATTNPVYVAASCQLCTGSGSDVKCDPTEQVTAAGLSVVTATIQPVAGSFTATGVSCDLGVPLFKLGATLANGAYKVLLKVSGMADTELLGFTIGGSTPGQEAGPSRKDGSGPSQKDGYTGPRTESGLPIGVDARRYDERGNPIGGDGSKGSGSSGGCSCRVASRSDAPLGALILLALLGLALGRGGRW